MMLPRVTSENEPLAGATNFDLSINWEEIKPWNFDNIKVEQTDQPLETPVDIFAHPEAHLEPEPIPIEDPDHPVPEVDANQPPIRPPSVSKEELRSQGQPLEPPGVFQGQGPSNDTPGQSTSMTNFIKHLTGNHVSQRVHVRSKVKRKVLLPLSGILCREFLDSYVGDIFCPEKMDGEKKYVAASGSRESVTKKPVVKKPVAMTPVASSVTSTPSSVTPSSTPSSSSKKPVAREIVDSKEAVRLQINRATTSSPCSC
eukprot:sb/3468557/